MTDQVTPEVRIDSYEAMMNANAELMDEIYRDGKLNAAEKLKNFSMGVRNQVLLSRDQAARRAELMRYGMKANGNLKALNFNPAAAESE
jgi:hypothetical protein